MVYPDLLSCYFTRMFVILLLLLQRFYNTLSLILLLLLSVLHHHHHHPPPPAPLIICSDLVLGVGFFCCMWHSFQGCATWSHIVVLFAGLTHKTNFPAPSSFYFLSFIFSGKMVFKMAAGRTEHPDKSNTSSIQTWTILTLKLANFQNLSWITSFR